MKLISKILLWLAILFIIAVAFIYPRMEDKGEETVPAPPAPVSRKIPVLVHTVRPGPLEDKIIVNGNILPDEEADLRSEVSGRVVEIGFEEGQSIVAGTVLVKINDAELVAEKRRLEYERSLARDIEKRQRRLLAEGTTSQENYDRSLNRLNTLKADLEVVIARLEKTVITAPFDGVVGFRHVSQGSYVTPNTMIASILEIDPVKIEFAIPEKYAGKVKVGNHIVFNLPSGVETYTGEVYAIEPRIDAITRTLPIRARASNRDGDLLPGSFASVTLVFERKENALLIPTESVIPILSGQKVYIEEAGVARERTIKTGIRTDSMIEVTEGLMVGDKVIRTGLLELREGALVMPTNEGSPPPGGAQ